MEGHEEELKRFDIKQTAEEAVCFGYLEKIIFTMM
jgi:hypothetical protein